MKAVSFLSAIISLESNEILKLGSTESVQHFWPAFRKIGEVFGKEVTRNKKGMRN